LADVRRVGERLLEPLPHDRVIVDDENPQPPRHVLAFWRQGTRTRTVVPAPDAPEMAKPPPTSCARSRIPTRPTDRALDASPAAMPMPSSRNSKMRSDSRRSSVTATRDAWLCLATLVSDS